jgi:hypothetical protein
MLTAGVRGRAFCQDYWQIVAQWVWNVRMELSQRTWPRELRTTQLAEALPPETPVVVEASPTMPQVPVLEASVPELAGQWARAPRPGLFAGKDFTPQENGTLRCPAGQPLWERERRPQADGSLRIYDAARRGSCRVCGLRAQCLRDEPTQVLGRKVSVVVGRPPAPPNPAAAELGAPLTVGTEPLLWRDWERRAGRRAWMGWLRSQQVSITRLSTSPPAQSRGSPILSRAERAHRRLSWAKRLSRNAARAQSPQVRIQLCGIPAALAHTVGLAS